MVLHNDDPLISIIVPVYGTECYFDRCISSLLAQSYKNLEIIVVNDGSKGNISELIQNYTMDCRIKFIDNKKNQGLLKARVCGARQATGSYIAFVDSDDYVSMDFYRVLVRQAQADGSDITIGKTVWEKAGYRYVYNYHESCFRFGCIENEEIRNAYFKQETQCYSWHTIWNKLYKKSLWDKCMIEFESVQEHIVMTEDIYFSSILFFYAKKVSCAANEAYFYCMNENASTDSQGISLEKFEKNMHDIQYVFCKVEGYLQENGAEQDILVGFRNGKSHYARMWGNLVEHSFESEERKRARELVREFCGEIGLQEVQHDYFFESAQTQWNGGTEYIKQQLAESEKENISFDIFDTLIVRPFYEPTDIFKLLNQPFFELVNANVSFEKLRVEGEKIARHYYGSRDYVEDISIEEIYDFIASHYQISKAVTNQMMQLEKELEIRYCCVRNTGKELFDFAREIGKRVILISDMYLDRQTIELILEKNGIQGYDRLFISSEERRLKYNGGLYQRAMSELDIKADDIIHIGDTWKSDMEGCRVAGIQSIFFPKAREIFENHIQGCQTNRCADIAASVCRDNKKYEKVKENIGYRCMQAIVANTYFDNPYRTFHAESDFNLDPYFIGFYLVGMHTTGICKWLDQLCRDKNYHELIFLARDGYLPMRAYKQYAQYTRGETRIQYMQASRKAVMPIMLRDKISFYQMPIEYRAHTVETLMEVLAFAVDRSEENLNVWNCALQNAGIQADKPFESEEELHAFIRVFFEKAYDEQKHRRECRKVERYYSEIPDNSVTFDMGYSGRIQAAICEASGKKVDAAFIHEDYQTSIEMRSRLGFNISNFYDYRPEITGLMREHIFSDVSGSCIGFSEENGVVVPVFEENKHTYPDRFVIQVMQQGAVDFTKTFLGFFGDQLDVVDFSPEEVSLPFEGFLRYPEFLDMHIFSASYFEDLVYGAREKINIEEFAMQNLADLGWPPCTEEKPDISEDMQSKENERIAAMIHGSSPVRRAVVWLLLDWTFFKEKLKINIRRLFRSRKGE